MPKNVDVSEIYASAIALFCERGFGGTTTRAVAERAGVNEVTLYRRFGSKAGLMEAAIGDALTEAGFGKVAATGDVTADLCAVVREYLATYEKHGSLALTLFAQLPHHPELRAVTPGLMKNVQGVATLLAAHQATGQVGPGDPERFALELIAPLAVIGVLKDMGVGPGHAGLDIGDYVRTFLAGHAAGKSL